MPSYRTRPRSILPYLAVAGTAAMVAWVMSHRIPRTATDHRDRTDPESRDSGSPVFSNSGLAAISPKVAAEAGEHAHGDFVRPAGRGAMRDPPRKWDIQDETSDESFPASDPPGNY